MLLFAFKKFTLNICLFVSQSLILVVMFSLLSWPCCWLMTIVDGCCWLMLLGSFYFSWLTSLSISCCVLLCYCLVVVLFSIACGPGLFFCVGTLFVGALLIGALLVGTLRVVTLLVVALVVVVVLFAVVVAVVVLVLCNSWI